MALDTLVARADTHLKSVDVRESDAEYVAEVNEIARLAYGRSGTFRTSFIQTCLRKWPPHLLLGRPQSLAPPRFTAQRLAALKLITIDGVNAHELFAHHLPSLLQQAAAATPAVAAGVLQLIVCAVGTHMTKAGQQSASTESMQLTETVRRKTSTLLGALHGEHGVQAWRADRRRVDLARAVLGSWVGEEQAALGELSAAVVSMLQGVDCRTPHNMWT